MKLLGVMIALDEREYRDRVRVWTVRSRAAQGLGPVIEDAGVRELILGRLKAGQRQL